jgi:hypothetical protein
VKKEGRKTKEKGKTEGKRYRGKKTRKEEKKEKGLIGT